MISDTATAIKTPQATIEKAMQDILAKGFYDAVHLFSDEGLPLATAANPAANGHKSKDQDSIAEMAILFHNVRRMAAAMADVTSLREVLIEGVNRRKIVFRFFQAFGQEVVLAVVVPANKSYRKVTNELEKLILEQSF
jgi:hypothetical protein